MIPLNQLSVPIEPSSRLDANLNSMLTKSLDREGITTEFTKSLHIRRSSAIEGGSAICSSANLERIVSSFNHKLLLQFYDKAN